MYNLRLVRHHSAVCSLLSPSRKMACALASVKALLMVRSLHIYQ